MSRSITDPEVRAVKSLCGHPELETAEQIAAGPYGEGLSARHFAAALQGLRDKLIVYEDEGNWRLMPDARKELCSSEGPRQPREEESREQTGSRTPAGSGGEDASRRSRLTARVS